MSKWIYSSILISALFFLKCGNPFDNGTPTTNNFRPGFTTTTTICPRTSYAQQVIALGAVAYWRLNDSGGSAVDLTGGGSNGTYQAGVVLGQPGVITGDSDSSAQFISASSQFVRIPQSTVVNTGTIKSVIGWFKTASTNVVIFTAGDTNINTYQLWITPAGLPSIWSNGGQIAGAVAVNDNNWHMGVAVWDGVNGYIYIDGVLKNSGARTIPGTGAFENQIGAQCTGLGSTTCNSYVNGYIDDVAVFNKALSASEILQLYQSITYATCGG